MPQRRHGIQEQDKQKEAQEQLLQTIEQFVEAMDEKGPYFFGDSFSLVDIMLIPWLLRQPLILKEYKNFEIPSSGSKTWDRYRLSRPHPPSSLLASTPASC